jgi:hypothetical protein
MIEESSFVMPKQIPTTGVCNISIDQSMDESNQRMKPIGNLNEDVRNLIFSDASFSMLSIKNEDLDIISFTEE